MSVVDSITTFPRPQSEEFDMVTHKAQAQFERSRWRLVLLLPIWTLQVLLTLGIMGLFAWRVGNTLKDYDKLKRDRNLPTIEFV